MAAAAATFYVRATGSDASDGRTPASAFASIRKAMAAVLNPGDRIVVGPGTYAEFDLGPASNGIANRPVVLFADRTGAETGDPPGPVVIRPPAGAMTGFLLLGRKGVTIDGFEILGSFDACIQVRTSPDGGTASAAIVIRNVVVSGCSKRGIDITAVGQVTVEDSISIGNVTGLSILGPGAAGAEATASLGQPTIVVRRNSLRGNTGAGLLLERIGSGTVSNNTVFDNGGAGIQLRSSTGVAVSDNEVRGNLDGGIAIGIGMGEFAVDDVAVSRNRVENNAGVAISIVATGSVSVFANTVPAAAANGIVVRGLGTAIAEITDNVVSSSAQDAVFVESVELATVARNRLDDAGENAIQVRNGHSATVVDNEIARSGSTAIDVGAEGDVVVARNSITTPGTVVSSSAIAVESLLGTAVVGVNDNFVRNAPSHGVRVAGAGAATVAGNDIESSGQNGINLFGVPDNSIIDNVVRFSGQDAIRVVGGGTFAATENLIDDNLGSAMLVEADADRAFTLDISNNSLTGHLHGIFVRGCSGGRVADNDIAANSLDGILLRRCSGVAIVGNQVTACGGNGILVNSGEELIGRDFAVRRNRVRNVGAAGIAVNTRGTVVATGNEVSASGSTALSVLTDGRARLIAANNRIRRSGSHGIFLQGADRGIVQNSVVHSSADTGVMIRTCPNMLVANNLIYANATDGLAIGTGGGASPGVTVTNNTLYGNGARGFVLGSGPMASSGATVVNNIFEANTDVGMAIDRPSATGLVSGFNINSDGHSVTTPVSPFDANGLAGFVSPAGPDGRIGGDDDGDDDFRLVQVLGGQAADSQAVDAGSGPASAIGVGGSTATGGAADTGTIDIGYHYGAEPTQMVRVPPPFMPLYVRASGSDANDGRDPSRAVGSIRRAALRAVSGATVIVGPGTYVESEPIRLRDGAARVSFIADRLGERTGDAPGPVVVDANGGDTGFVVLGAAGVTIDGFHVTNAATAGIQIRAGSHDAVVRNNVVFSNARRGIEISGADTGRIVNNLVYANGTGGVQVQQSRGSEVLGNTIYGNGENGVTIGIVSSTLGRLDRAHAAGEDVLVVWLGSSDATGIMVAGASVQIAGDPRRYRVAATTTATLGRLAVPIEPPLVMPAAAAAVVTDHTLAAENATVQRNVVAGNQLGILVNLNSIDSYTCGGNVVQDGIPGRTPRCDSDILDDPVFVDPNGADGVLGGAGFVDDDFRLVPELSPAVDLTSCTEELLPPEGTTDPDGFPDECPIDSGYHYPLAFGVAGLE